MKLILITPPHFFPQEADALNYLLENTSFRLHIRKPKASKDALEKLIQQIDEKFYSRVVLHDAHSLALKYPLGGIHLNKRNPTAPDKYAGTISSSCHSWNEVLSYRNTVNYLFISPLYDSISKQGYSQAFTESQLQEAQEKGWIDQRVIGLGGIAPDKIPLLKSYGFGGVAVLGYVWKDFIETLDYSSLQARLRACEDQIQLE